MADVAIDVATARGEQIGPLALLCGRKGGAPKVSCRPERVTAHFSVLAAAGVSQA